ncbi:HAD-IB family hydrolase [Candidatus Saccharibacteria bacterium]|nr:HAD-IB family hydrolase [Candidatus Saccharibacteria bacterium]
MAKKSDRPFAAFDLDGTLIRWQLYHATTDEMVSRGFIKPESYKAMRDARMAWKRRSGASFRDYEIEVIGIYDDVIKSLDFEQVDTVIDAVFDKYKDQVYTYTRDLLAKLKSQGYLLFAISGSQIEIVAKIAQYYGFDDYAGSVYERTAEGFSGEKTIGALFKDKTMKELVAKHKATYGGSMAIGDSHSDIAMLQLVEQPIAFNPEASLFDYAKTRGWKIVIERKNVVIGLESKNGQYQLV